MSEELKAALARIACLEGEIAKRDARIMGLESQYQRDVWGLNNEGDPIGGEPAGGYANDNARLRAELAAIKAQEPVEYQLRALIRDVTNIPEAGYYMPQSWHDHVIALSLSGKLDAPVSEAKAQGVYSADPLACSGCASGCFRCRDVAKVQGVVMPEGWIPLTIEHEPGYPEDVAFGPKRMMDRLKKWLDRYFEMRLNAAPVQQVSVPDASTDFSQFLSAVMDAAGLVRHGRRSKELSEYLGSKCMEYRCFAAPAAPAADATVRQATDGGRNQSYEGLFDGETEEQRASRLAAHSAKGVV